MPDLPWHTDETYFAARIFESIYHRIGIECTSSRTEECYKFLSAGIQYEIAMYSIHNLANGTVSDSLVSKISDLWANFNTNTSHSIPILPTPWKGPRTEAVYIDLDAIAKYYFTGCDVSQL